MREIKFRVWDERENDMILWDRNEFRFMPIKNLSDNGFNECFKIMQYTGRRDANDIEIYEDDFVLLYTKSEYLHKHDWNVYSGIVKMLDGQWVVFDDKTNQPLYGFGDVKVMGNIHENPELL